jgi:hypothetical protein
MRAFFVLNRGLKMKKPGLVVAMLSIALLFVACAPEVGSEEWCEAMDEKEKGDWSANEAKEYAKNCVFRKRDDD